MMEHPISFSTPMVKAILEKKKTQTRRKINEKISGCVPTVVGRNEQGNLDNSVPRPCPDWCIEALLKRCPYGHVGDKLWVREKLQKHLTGTPIRYFADGCPVMYKGESADVINWTYRYDVLPSILMPRWASRLTLEITDIRVQRLQEISEEDILAEGTPCHHISQHLPHGELLVEDKYDYRKLWDSINGKTHPWESNPWVWAISFKLLEGTK
jgi:hypothetical protein